MAEAVGTRRGSRGLRRFPGAGAAVVALAVLLALGGCARAGTPAGGDVPETPLRIVEAEPEAFAQIRPFDGPVRIHFHRRVSERPTTGTLRDAVVVSPRTGTVEVRHRRRGLEIRMDGGFREETIYRVTLLPVIQDLFRNQIDGPFELFFSTGPEFEPNVLGGLVTDRLSGEDVAGARVDVRTLPEGVVHSTVADSTGIFTFPWLPAGEYRVVAYQDANRNRLPDFPEPQDSLEVTLARGDTVIVTELALLPRDTTAAVLQSTTVEDSVTVRVTFDDFLDPEESLDPVTARLSREEEDAPEVVEILHLHEWEARMEAERMERERREREEADPEVPEEPRPEVPEEPFPEEEPEPQDPGPPLPARDLVLILSEPLEPGATYQVEIAGVRNINGIPDGGGEVTVEVPEPPEEPPEEVPPEEPPPGADPG